MPHNLPDYNLDPPEDETEAKEIDSFDEPEPEETPVDVDFIYDPLRHEP